MSLFGSLYTGAAGMMAQSKATAIVSQNIANISTTGYKRSEAFFHELVTTGANGTWSGPGSVVATRVLRAEQQGSIQRTSSDTDAAISGAGFFAVKRSEADREFSYTRNGAFNEDANGILRNTAGMILYAWAFTDEEQIPRGSLSSLVPARIDIADMSPIPTTSARLAFNLDASQKPIDPHVSGQTQLPANSLATHFTRTITVYDGRTLSNSVNESSVAHDVSFEFRHIVGPMAHFTTNTSTQLRGSHLLASASGPTPSIAAGDTFTIEVVPSQAAVNAGAAAAGVVTIEFVDAAAGDDPGNFRVATVQGLMEALRNYGTGNELSAYITEEGRILVKALDPGATINLNAPGPNNPLSGSGTLNIIQDPDSPADYSFEPDFDITSIGQQAVPGGGLLPPNPVAYPDQATDFPAFANIANPNPFGWWEVTILKSDPSDPSGQTKIKERTGLLNFNRDGSLNAAPDAGGNIQINLASRPIDFNPATTGDEVGFTVDISRFTQYSGNYSVLASTQNGAGAGRRTGISITDDGIIQSVYSNGLRQNLYQIPLAIFMSPNGLDENFGTSFTESTESGIVVLARPGTMGAGHINSSALESSNVEISDEFSRMIMSQKGYTLSSKVISTIDQMTQRLSEMSR